MSEDNNLTISVIQRFREKLLDLTKRNNLISLRFPKNSSRIIRIVDISLHDLIEMTKSASEIQIQPLPNQNSLPTDEVNAEFINKLEEKKLIDSEYQQKIDELGSDPSDRAINNVENWLRDKLRAELGLPPINRKMPTSVQDHANSLNINPDYELSLRPTDDRNRKTIQTLLYPEKLERVCKKISGDCKLYENEAGINILFLALGSLCWYESDDSEKLIRSPLILIPVEIKKIKKGNIIHYSLQRRDDSITLNLSLREKMLKDFGINIPVIEDEDEPDILQLFLNLEKLIKNQNGWKIEKTATIGFFSFAKLAMYHDLSFDKWTENDFREGSLIESLINGKNLSKLDHSVDYSDLDARTIDKNIPATITDVDSSQMSAILDVLEGKDLVIQGPPGTGKSQTITNIIAATIERGKKVLFIAEKKAALEVVKNRLDHANLKEFCLELHSNKTKRSEIAKSFQESYELRKKHLKLIDISQDITSLQEARDEILNYINLLNSECRNIKNETYHRCFWKIINLKSKIENSEEFCLIGSALDMQRLTKNLPKISELLIDLYKENHESFSNTTKFEEHVLAPYFLSKNDINSYEEFVSHARRVNNMLIGVDLNQIASIEADVSTLSIDDIRHLSGILRIDNIRIQIDIFKNILNLSQTDLYELKSQIELFHARKNTLLQISSNSIDLDTPLLSLLQTDITEKYSSFTLHQIKLLLDNLKLEKEALSSYENIVLNTCKRYDILPPRTTQDIITLVDFFNKFKDSNIEEFRFINNNILHELPSDYFNKASEKIVNLTSLEKSVKNVFGNELTSLNEDEIDHLISTYTTTSFWKRLSKPYRDAKSKIFKSLNSINRSRRFVELCLSDLNRYTSAKSFLQQDAYLQYFFKDKVINQSDLASIQKERLFTHSLTSFGQQTAYGKSLFDWFIHQSIESLNSFLNHTTPDFYTKYKKIEHRLSQTSHTSLKDIVSRIEDKIRKLSQIEEFAEYYGVYDTRTVDDLFIFQEELSAYKKTFQILKENEAIYGFDFFMRSFNDFVDLTKKTSIIKNIEKIQIIEKYLFIDGFVDFSNPQYLALLNYINASLEASHFIDTWSCSELGKEIRSISDPTKVVLHFRTLFQSLDELVPFIQSTRSYTQLSTFGLQPFLNLVKTRKLKLEQAIQALHLIIYDHEINELYKMHPALRLIQGNKLDELRKRYKNLDTKILLTQRQRLPYSLTKTEVELGQSTGRVRNYTELGFIKHQISLNSKHAPIREYFIKAPISALALKPCLMMSPLSVSQYLPAGNFKFDLVIMDEASQLRPEDALGAILRAKQVVIVGDPKQLPPTDFFNFSDNEESDDEDLNDAVSYESILDMALKSFRPARMLKWHYRSKHETLIKQSNEMFYDGNLIIFPSPHFEDENFGFQFDYVENGEYQNRRNIPEAKRIMEHISKHIMSRPDQSLGIVTMNKDQQELLANIFDRELNSSPHFQNFISKFENTLEPFIIKNLENIQGDERDVIIVSTLYGKSPGATKFHQRFGPINHKMGHRRLNVLFTRARYKTLVVSSLDPDFIITQDSSNEGVKAFKRFLEYARSKKIDEGVYSLGTPDNDFEQFVMNAVSNYGFEVHAQIGVSGYKIDLGVLHPNIPGKYILGIECDGATYHSSKYAKDRDKIRQEILESLGWKIHRVWSTDWFSNKDREITKLIDAIKTVLALEGI